MPEEQDGVGQTCPVDFESYVEKNNIEKESLFEGYFKWLDVEPQLFANYTIVEVGGYKGYEEYGYAEFNELDSEQKWLCQNNKISTKDYIERSLFNRAFFDSINNTYDVSVEPNDFYVLNINIKNILSTLIETDFKSEDEYRKIFDIFFQPQLTGDIYKKLPTKIQEQVVDDVGELISIGFIDILDKDTKKRVMKRLKNNIKPSQAIKEVISEISQE
jgi:hypothetical protein